MGKMFAKYICVWIIFLSSCGVSGELDGGSEQLPDQPIGRVTFGDASLFTKLNTTLSDRVYHMEADRFIPGNIIMSHNRTMSTTNGTTTTTIAGRRTAEEGYRNGVGENAEFSIIDSFVQKSDANFVILADTRNHCLRLLNRGTKEVSDLAGTCQNGGSTNGNATTAKFSYPRGLLFHPRNPVLLYIMDHGNSAVRLLHIDQEKVSDVVKSESILFTPLFATWENYNADSMLVAGETYITRLSLDPQQTCITKISGNASGYNDGPLLEARFQHLRELIYVHDNLYFATDSWNGHLRVVNLQNNNVTTICTRNGGCGWSRAPYSLLLINSTLYVGLSGFIKILPIFIERTEVLTTKSYSTDNPLTNARTVCIERTEVLTTKSYSTDNPLTNASTVFIERTEVLTTKSYSTDNPLTNASTEVLNTTPKKEIAILPIGILSGILAISLVLIVVLAVVIIRLRSALRSLHSTESTNQALMSPDLELASAVNANYSEYEDINSTDEDSHRYSVLKIKVPRQNNAAKYQQ